MRGSVRLAVSLFFVCKLISMAIWDITDVLFLNYQRMVNIPIHQTGCISKYYSDPQFAFPLGRDEIAIIVVEIGNV